jgi:hypothetical protein
VTDTDRGGPSICAVQYYSVLAEAWHHECAIGSFFRPEYQTYVLRKKEIWNAVCGVPTAGSCSIKKLQDRDSWMVDPAAAQIPLGVFSS